MERMIERFIEQWGPVRDGEKKYFKSDLTELIEEASRWAFMAGESSFDLGDMTFDEYWKTRNEINPYQP